MKITGFEIENFKGIKKVKIDLSDSSPGNISTIIGLNESGKTTILEALSLFGTEDKETANLVGTVYEKSKFSDFIPKDKKAAFTGSVIIRANVVLEDIDVDLLASNYKENGYALDGKAMRRGISIERCYDFKDSVYTQLRTSWAIDFKLKKGKSSEFKRCTGTPSSPKADKDAWLIGAKFLRGRLPKTIYFPTFLFDFPGRIYLDNSSDIINKYYRNVLQDVLDSRGDGLDIDRHIVERIQRLRESHGGGSNFLSHLLGSDEKKQIDAVLQKASAEMSKVIFGSWNEIFGRKVAGKRVQIDWLLDADNGDRPYVEVSIVDGQSTYSLSERSLGFRWFFSFLLFTQFRANRKAEVGTIFLFDEPASNLHSRAQIKLLESFLKIARGATYIVYSTHSHYMINPLWLERAYIVKNEAADYESDDDMDFYEPRESDIKAIKYKTFVGTYPRSSTYFQPVLDALDVPISSLVSAKNALIVEGKYDFHPLVYFSKVMCLPGSKFNIFPATGSGSISPLIALFRGWGVNFRILLDGDDAGKKERGKYRDQMFVPDDFIRCLSDFDPIFDGKALEAAYQGDVVDMIKENFGVDRPKKEHYSLLFQELVATGKMVALPETEVKLRSIIEWFDSEFKAIV